MEESFSIQTIYKRKDQVPLAKRFFPLAFSSVQAESFLCEMFCVKQLSSTGSSPLCQHVLI